MPLFRQNLPPTRIIWGGRATAAVGFTELRIQDWARGG